MTLAMELERWKRACREETSLSIAKSMLENGISVELIASSTKLPMERILALQDELHNKPNSSVS